MLPALLKRFAGIDEVVTTLLLNPVALLLLQGLLNGPWRNPESGFPDSDRLRAPATTLPLLFGGEPRPRRASPRRRAARAQPAW